MRHWKVTLMRDGRSQRQWHLRGEAVSLGAHPTCSVRLPRPAPDLLLEVAGSQAQPIEVPWNDSVLVVEDVTCTVDSLLRQAQVRMESQTPRETWNGRQGLGTLTAVCLLLLAALLSPFFGDQRPRLLQALQVTVAQMEAQRLSLAPAPTPHLEAARPHAQLPGAPGNRVPLALVLVSGGDLGRFLNGSGDGSAPSKGGKDSHPLDLDRTAALGIFPAPSSLTYLSPASSLYRSPDPAGPFQPG